MNDIEFFEIIETGITVVDFYANWCNPCKGQTIVFNYLKEEFKKNNIKVLKINVEDKNLNIITDFEIKNIPTIIIFKDGEEINRSIGLTNADTIWKMIKKS